ncbi:MAG: TauD/TfdA dioxygenase family protein [Reyranella sp.]|uniref:TauD/TfdA dioxygenase family protein n=1 Tax=Reyranella sp. TaxID=1929291 RepID=UPI003D0F563E
MEIERPDPGIGAIATDVDVRALSEADWNTLYRTWLDGIVLVVRGQTLGIEEFLAYSRRFGRLKPHRVKRTRHAEFPELTVMGVGTRKADGQVDKTIYDRGGGWHTDSPWDTEICKATQLYAIAIPSYGGDTLFASMYEAYETLPESLKQRIAGMKAEHVYGGRGRRGNDLLDPEDRNRPPAVHPIVRVHEETGRTSLYANPYHIVRIQGLSDAESESLIAELTGHMVETKAQYRHKWQVGDIVIWDNRCALHSATGGYPIEEKRIHWRVTIMQDPAEAEKAA